MTSRLVIRGHALAQNTLLNLLGQGIPLVVAVLTIPLIIKGLGIERFGIVTLAWVLLDSFGVFDLGLGRAATKFVAEALGRGEDDRVSAIAWSAVIAQGGLGVFGGLVLIGIAPILVARLHVSPPLLREATFSFVVLSAAVPIGMISASLRGVLEAAQRFDLVNSVRMPFGITNFVIPVMGIIFSWHLPTMIALLVISRATALLIYYRLATGLFPSLRRPTGVHRSQLKVLLGYGGWLTVSSIVAPVLIYLDRFLVGVILSVAAVAYYAAPYEMVTRLWIVPTSLVATLFPAFSALTAIGDHEATQRLMTRSIRYLLLALGPLIVVIIAFGHDIIRQWLGPQFARQSSMALQILAAGVLVNSVANVPYSLLQASGRPDLPAKLHLAELPLHVILAWFFVRRFGIPGAALAWSVRVTIDATLLFILINAVSPNSAQAFRDTKLRLTVSLMLAFGILTVCASSFSSGLLRFLLPSLGLVFLAGAAWRYSLDQSERGHVLSTLRLNGTPRP